MRPHQTTHYDVLGIETDSSIDEIRAAFRKLTREHHPDRYRGDARERAESRFQEITEAFNVLSRPESREKYDREISQGKEARTMDRSEIARKLAAKGAQSLKEGRLAEALENLKLAIDHDDNCARAHYFMGLALARAAGREKDALRHLEKAVAVESNNATMKAEAAHLALKVGLRSRAVRFAEQALALDPTNLKAQEVLQRVESEDSSGGDGLFGRLRRKG